ncbi:hypothetical protein CCUS01_11464 [Colletotrichum cuscutae]|uniref:Uncharacterized protein n=1 Tax=Colletotrichum cuscutae TaxID=1209917 RepID=A0AAI9XJ03_9PEZI|nr:hypothetical protein CCUS01_11464 [Colletotrichum cuscutae]
MQFKSLAITAAVAGFVAAAPTTESHVSAVNAEDKDVLIKLATQYGAASVTGPDIEARDNTVVRRACGYES